MIAIYKKPNNDQSKEVREVCKSYGIKKCSKGINFINVGSQEIGQLSKKKGHELIDELKGMGYYILDEDTIRELTDKGMFTGFMVAKIVE